MVKQRAVTSIAALLSSFLVFLMLGSPVQAAATAFNLKTQYLTAFPDDSMGTSCQPKTIYLASGNYTWYAYYRYSDGWTRIGASKTIYLQEANYTWRNCLDPIGPPPGYLDGHYHQNSKLQAITDGDSIPAYLDDDFKITPLYSGTWTWGTALDPQF